VAPVGIVRLSSEPRDTTSETGGMPIYYFNIHDDDVTLDEEGVERADYLSAFAYAISAARSLAVAGVLEGQLILSDRIEIEDENHQRIATVRFDQAVAIRE
jgi:hypothetical protein